MELSNILGTTFVFLLVFISIGAAIYLVLTAIEVIINSFVLKVPKGLAVKVTPLLGARNIEYKYPGRYIGPWFLYERKYVSYPFAFQCEVNGKTNDGGSVEILLSVYVTLTNPRLTDEKFDEFQFSIEKQLAAIGLFIIDKNSLLQFSKIVTISDADLQQLKAAAESFGMQIQRVEVEKSLV